MITLRHVRLAAALNVACSFGIALAGCSGAGGTATAVTPEAPKPPSGTITQFGSNLTPIGDITSGPDGALWFTEPDKPAIGRITTAGVVTEFTAGITPGDPSSPMAITAGPDGALWFTGAGFAPGTRTIGRITVAGAVTEFHVSGYPTDIVTGPDGALWFAESFNDAVGRITTGGTVTEYPNGSPQPTLLPSIASGPDGALWYADQASGHFQMNRITVNGAITHFPTALTWDGNEHIAAGSDGALWSTGGCGTCPALRRTTTSGVTAVVDVSPLIATFDITSGPDGALWVTAFDGSSNGNVIARVTTSGAVTRYPVVGSFVPGGNGAAGFGPITTGPDGGIWFGEVDSATGKTGKIGRIQP